MTKYTNNCWHTNGDANTVYIFIHGLYSDSERCWRNSNGTFWPDLIKNDEVFDNPSIFLAGYFTEFNSGSYDIAQCAKEVLEAITLRRNSSSAPIDASNIVFICHSMGGVVCRHILEKETDLFKEKNIGLVLISSPSMGSNYADALKKISKIYKQKIISNLTTTSETLNSIDNRFRDILNNRKLNITGAEACEARPPIFSKWLPIPLKRIVDESSGSRYFGGTRLIAKSDHSSIAKPESSGHGSHLFLASYVQNIFSKNKINQSKAISSSEAFSAAAENKVTPNPLFDIFSKTHAAYYFKRDVDLEIERKILNSSIWIFGVSGCGKTSAARHVAYSIPANPIEVTLSQLNATTATPDDFFEEVLGSLTTDTTKLQPSLRDVSRAVSEKANESVIPILLDEVNISPTCGGNTITHSIGLLLDNAKKIGRDDTKFIICSIREPQLEQMPQKMREQIQKIELKKWSDSELIGLIEFLGNTTKRKISNRDDIKKIVKSADGSPRFIKILFRKLISDMDSTNGQLEVALSETTDQMKGVA